MKNKFRLFVASAAAAALLSSCNFLDPLVQEVYTDENIDQYPEILRGFVDKIYNDYRPVTFYSAYYIGLSAITEEAVYSSATTAKRVFSEGNGVMTGNPYEDLWTNNYQAINYANLFLKDNKGYNTRYMLNAEADKALRECLQGDAFGLRAYMHFGLLKMFAGEGTDNKMYGIPIKTEPTEFDEIDNSEVVRASIDQCCEQILSDCDKAYEHLYFNNRDYPGDPSQVIIVTGSARYTTLDKIAIDALRAQVYLYWASPAWNPGVSQDDPKILERYSKAAQYAAAVMKHKLEKESTLLGGFDPAKKINWSDPNSQEIIWCGHTSSGTTTWETNLYPIGFGGSATIVPTQLLVDRFPDSKGYPISDPRSSYDPHNPFANRDPRFYSTINYNGSEVIRNTDPTDIMYTFDTTVGGADAPGQTGTSTTGYYIRKFLYTGWNPFDANIQNSPRPLMHFRWTEMCLIFAEAASRVVSPNDANTFGYSARQALAFLRSRTTPYDMPGLGATADPYLDECAAAGGDKFYELVKNEWRIETCFEGQAFYNSRRWATSVADINVPVERVVISGDSYKYENVTTLNFPSIWQPLPYLEVRRCPNLIQNKGWDSWK